MNMCCKKPSAASPTISAVHVKPGDLAIDDCQLAASQFILMCQASLFLPFVFQVAPAPFPRTRRRGGRQRDTDFSGGVSGEGHRRLALASFTIAVTPPTESSLRHRVSPSASPN